MRKYLSHTPISRIRTGPINTFEGYDPVLLLTAKVCWGIFGLHASCQGLLEYDPLITRLHISANPHTNPTTYST